VKYQIWVATLILATSQCLGCERAAPGGREHATLASASVSAKQGVASAPPAQLPAPPLAPAPGPALVPDLAWAKDFKGVKTLSEKHPLGVLSAVFLPDGRRALSSGVDGVARLWNLDTGSVQARFSGPQFQFPHALVTKDGQRVLSTGQTTDYWQLANGQTIRSLTDPEYLGASAIALTHDERRAAVSFAGLLVIWELETGTIAAKVPMTGHGTVFSLAFGPDDAELTLVSDLERCSLRTSGGGPLSCRGFPKATGNIVSAGSGARVSVLASRDVDFAHGADGTAPPSGALFLWDNATAVLSPAWQLHEHPNALDASETGEVVVYGSRSAVTLWDGPRRRNLARVSAADVTSVALSVGAELVLIGQGDGSVRLWKPSKPH